MTKKSHLPVAVFSNFPDNKLGNELKEKLEGLGLEAEMYGFQTYPTSNKLAAKYAAALIFVDLAAQTQLRRIQGVADNANIPVALLRRQAASWKEELAKIPLFPPSETDGERLCRVLAEVEEKGRGVGWIRSQVPELPANVKSPSDFIEWLGRRVSIPESCEPELLRLWTQQRRHVPLPSRERTSSPPSSPHPEPAPAAAAPAPVPPGTVDKEEYDLLKEEYDLLAAKMEESTSLQKQLADRIRELEEVNASLIGQVADLSKELEKGVSGEAVKKLAADWKEEGRREGRREAEEQVAELQQQVVELSKELAGADGRESELEKALRQAEAKLQAETEKQLRVEQALHAASKKLETANNRALELEGAVTSLRFDQQKLAEIRRILGPAR